ncbi:MAG: hypothetical protein ACR2PL_26955 [Dehalococcoidia bacterium]
MRTGHWGNQASPFWAWAEFPRSDPDKEALVLTVAFHAKSETLQMVTDLIEEQGPVLSALPER